jgi:hypothetical protein
MAAMVERIRKEWRVFAAEAAGERFEKHYERKRLEERTLAGRLSWLAAGVFFVLAGIVMLFTPGPGLLAIGFGVTCFAQESRGVARSCDRMEMRVRRAWTRWRDRGKSGQ